MNMSHFAPVELLKAHITLQDLDNEWWALMGLVLTHWRKGNNDVAREFFQEAERLSITKA